MIPLSTREGQILECINAGMRNKEIAVQVGLKESTVATYCSRLCEKFKVTTRYALLKVIDLRTVPPIPINSPTTCYRVLSREEALEEGDFVCATVGILRPLDNMVVISQGELNKLIWDAEDKGYSKAVELGALPPAQIQNKKPKIFRKAVPENVHIETPLPEPIIDTSPKIEREGVLIKSKYWIKVKDCTNPKTSWEYAFKRAEASVFTQEQAEKFIIESGLSNTEIITV